MLSKGLWSDCVSSSAAQSQALGGGGVAASSQVVGGSVFLVIFSDVSSSHQIDANGFRC